MEEKVEKVQEAKPSYEQLEKEVAGLKSMNSQLIMQLQQMNMGNLFKRLDYLFQVIKFREAFNPEFADKCIKEVEGHMTLPVEEKPEEENTSAKE